MRFKYEPASEPLHISVKQLFCVWAECFRSSGAEPATRAWGLRFGVWGLGFGVWGVGFMIWVLGLRVQSFEFKVQGSGLRVDWGLVSSVSRFLG